MASKDKKKKTEEETPDWRKSLVLFLHDLIYMLIAILLVFLLLFREIVVSGDSMYSTLWDGDYLLLLSNVFYHEPKQGDIIVISKKTFEDGTPIVKRVIATEGQTVDIDFNSGVVYVNDQPLTEPYTNGPTVDSAGTSFPLTVEENCLFVLGDNRGVSKDSRSWEIGQIDKREVLGKALFRFLPGTNHDTQERDYTRIGAVK